jgi:hypothetical protein
MKYISHQGNLSKILSSASRLYTPSFSMTTITLASFDVTLISTPSSVKPFASRSIHSLVMGKPCIEESAVPSIEPLTSLPEGNVPFLVISMLPQNQPEKQVCQNITKTHKLKVCQTRTHTPLGLADNPRALLGTPKHLATSKIAESHSF